MRQRGYVVFPCEAAPENGAQYREFVAGQLQQASVSVHMLGELYGAMLEGEKTRSTIDVQIEEAGRIAATGALQRVLWLSEKLEPKEERQENFLGTLRRDAANEANTELLETSIENLKTYLLRKLAETPKPVDGVKAAGTPPLVYLIHDQRDVEAIEPLRDALMARGYEVKPSYFEGNETELREYHQENLVQCDGATYLLRRGERILGAAQAFGSAQGVRAWARACVSGESSLHRNAVETGEAAVPHARRPRDSSRAALHRGITRAVPRAMEAAAMNDAWRATASDVLNPFVGLRPFEEYEAYLFFGRDGQSDKLVGRLAHRRFLAVVGASGSGKSSLVRAGLFACLRGGFMATAGSSWRIALLRPGSTPLASLAAALHDALRDPSADSVDVLSTALIETTLRRSSLGLIEAVRQARIPRDENILVVVDQFEELFRFKRASRRRCGRGRRRGVRQAACRGAHP